MCASEKTSIPSMLFTLLAPRAKVLPALLSILFFVALGRSGKLVRYPLSSTAQSPMRNVDVGLYTSPHLIAVRERIRVNGVPISEELFAKFFFDVWDRLEENHRVGSLSSVNVSTLLMREHRGSFQLQQRSQCISDMLRLWHFTRS